MKYGGFKKNSAPLIHRSSPILEDVSSSSFKASRDGVEGLGQRKSSLVGLPVSHLTKEHLPPKTAPLGGEFNTR